MRPEQKSYRLLDITRAQAKMLEYSVPDRYHIKISQDPAELFTLSIGLLGDIAAAANCEEISSQELRDNLSFSARFFDSYIQSKLNTTLDQYLALVGSASYYLCDRPGSASVLAENVTSCPDLNSGGLESLLLWLMKGHSESYNNSHKGHFGELIDKISAGIFQFFKEGTGKNELLDLCKKLRREVYEFGTPRQLLFGDTIAAILKKKIENSTWESLPMYSDLSRGKWSHVLQKASFIKELWPAQHSLGEANVLKGRSAIVQMPTSAGKTKAIELILRSAFLSDRDVHLAVIVAPFRALCHEIKDSLFMAFQNERIKINELSDVLQEDFEIADISGHQQILVVTPEKLLYVLRHEPNLFIHIGLLIFDEGHQFDSGDRGITYELLLTSLRLIIPKEVQKVLISAVINNAERVGEWLSDEVKIVEKTDLIPTFRSVGFTSWSKVRGIIEYVDNKNPEQRDFFVPRVIEKQEIQKKGRETKDRFFPEKGKDCGSDVALYLGLKLVSKGSVAVFCGRKDTVEKICKKVVDIAERKVSLDFPREFSVLQEIDRLVYLHIRNMGADTPASKSAEHGIFCHQGNTPYGIRLAVKYAMRKELVRFVICTATLAQGVNLPIRYLIVTSVYQERETIKVRDFHNLIGRAGRAGMHTEGGILFANPKIYDNRRNPRKCMNWINVKNLLDSNNSEPCVSTLLSIFDPIKGDNGKSDIPINALDFVRAYIGGPDEIRKMVTEISEENKNKGCTREEVSRQIVWRINLICAVESFLLSRWDGPEGNLSVKDAISLAEMTLAFFVANEQEKKHIRELFELLANNISNAVPDDTRRRVFARTMYGIQDSQLIEKWVTENANKLLAISDETEVLDIFWSLLTEHVKNKMFAKIDPPDVIKEIARAWIEGKSFIDLLRISQEMKAMRKTDKKKFEIQIYNIIEMCEQALSYEGALLVGAICEFIGILDQEGVEETITRLQLFQKRLRYGLKTKTSISLYEEGFSDRVIAQEVAEVLANNSIDRSNIIVAIRERKDDIEKYINKFPSYFIRLFERIIES